VSDQSLRGGFDHDARAKRTLRPGWCSHRRTKNIPHLVYPTPRGMLPSVRSLIDYLLIQVPARLPQAGCRVTYPTSRFFVELPNASIKGNRFNEWFGLPRCRRLLRRRDVMALT
jgi:hypothetical protein